MNFFKKQNYTVQWKGRNKDNHWSRFGEQNRYLLRMSDSVNKGWGRKIDWLTLKRRAGV